MSDNDPGFYSPLFNNNRISVQTPPIISDPSSDAGDACSTLSSSPTSMYSNNSHQLQDSYESDVVHAKHNNNNGTFVDDNNSLSTIISNNLTKEQKLYHSSSLRSINNIYSVNLSPTDENFNIQAHSTSILNSSSLVTIPCSNDNNTLTVEPSNTTSFTNGKNGSSEKTCNVEVVSDFYVRGGKGGFWGDLWRMSLIKDGKPTPKFWLILIGLLALILLIVIPTLVVISNQSSPSSPPNKSNSTRINNNGTAFSAPSAD